MQLNALGLAGLASNELLWLNVETGWRRAQVRKMSGTRASLKSKASCFKENPQPRL